LNIPADFTLWQGDSPLDLVADFHHAFNHPIASTPIDLETLMADLTEKRLDWQQEEQDEAWEARTTGDRVKFVDAICDQLYFIYGTALALGIPLEACFNAVHDANMAKLGPDGKPIYRESDGKVQKPEGWVGPEDRIAEILRQADAAGSPFELAA
jgi:predicted HAD superfamily Cof-like phosphohydrolase